MSPGIRKKAMVLALIPITFLVIQYLVPLVLPFLLGAALALAAEPMVRFLCARLRLPRGMASILGVAMAFALLGLAILVCCALVFRQIQALAGALPNMEETIRSGLGALSGWLLEIADGAPAVLREPLARNVENFFSNGSALLEKITGYVLHLASGILSRLPNGALAFVTGLISSFMISTKLSQIRMGIARRFPAERIRPWLETAKSLKVALLGWLKAQVKLSGVTFGLLTISFLLLGISYGPLWAFLVALVDAFPILGTGAVLVPWSLISFLQGDTLRAFGLLGAYAVVTVTRTVLEPRLVGRQLGLDPLVTLVCFYAGFRLWGIWGMILAPMLAVVAVQLTGEKKSSKK